MATMYPDWNTIHHLKQKATEGELHLLNFLDENLNESYEVYFQPYLNGDRPDIVIMRKGSGVLIIEVKDWNEKFFQIDGKKFIFEKDDKKVQVKSPVSQVMKYKDNLYDLHIENLLKKNITNQNHWSIISLMLYFHNFSLKKIENVRNGNKCKKYFGMYCKENLDAGFKEYLKLINLYDGKSSFYFTEDIYKSIKRYLQPPQHTIDQGLDIKLTIEQKEIINSYKKNQKVLGVAGSGKSLVLDQRAVKAYERTKSKVLILFYNITLRNYLHDQLNKVRKDFPWENFRLLHYHEFIDFELNNLGINIVSLYINTFKQMNPKLVKEIDNLDIIGIDELNKLLFNEISKKYIISIWSNEDKEYKKFIDDYNMQKSDIWDKALYSNINLFNSIENISEDKFLKYDTIIVDEGQDFKEEWLRILNNNFRNKDGEFVIFADEKQNLYERPVDIEKLPVTPISGPWNKKLNQSFRFSDTLVLLANKYQEKYLKKYDKRKINEDRQGKVKFNENNIEYYPNTTMDNNLAMNIFQQLKDKSINPNDVVVLSISIELLKSFDSYYREISKEKTETDFETKEFTKYLIDQFINSKSKDIYKMLKSNNDKNYLDNYKRIKDIYKGNLQIALEKVIDKLGFNESDNSIVEKDIIFKNIIPQSEDIKYKITKDEANRLISQIEKIRQNKKYHFHMNPGCMKISTVHSFKGCESPVIVLFIPYYIGLFQKYELLYVGLTRAKERLIIYEEDDYFKEFFDELITIISTKNDK